MSEKQLRKSCSAQDIKRRKKPKRRNAPGLENSLEGILVAESQSGRIVVSQNASMLFNPASNIKVATSLAVLRKLGPEHRFQTKVSSTGSLSSTGELKGDLYVDGNYMLFGDRQAKELAAILNKKGIRKISGDLYVSSSFSMNLHATASEAGARLKSVLDTQAGLSLPFAGGEELSLPYLPQVKIGGSVKIGTAPPSAKALAIHGSAPLKDILKIMLCYSDNTMAERFGDMIGGAKALSGWLVQNLGISPAELSLASTSGLGINRVTPQAMLSILFGFRAELARFELSYSDLMAVAGIDEGTLKNRLKARGQAGSVLAKTGTLIQTDNGASALSGEVGTARGGSFLFVIFHMHGDVNLFRQRQDAYLSEFQKQNGGAQAFPYVPILPRIDSEDFWSLVDAKRKPSKSKSRRKS